MNADIRELLLSGGIDIDAMLDRCMGNEALLERLLKKFPVDRSYSYLVEALQNGDENAAVDASHTLKGVAGNLSIKDLYTLVDSQVQALRNHNMDAALSIMPDITLKYNNAVNAIQRAFN
ncbi:Hpt domain-containing protein [uncultured Mailhella sp.]|uniref:Hpt domain-containing protein n=1 Tax=uncultured Mailhella sp. TaxID=1981031 RepID=UPI0025D50335|nr:Hpt domain-containing protein [uncultured Mailhella sp.]